MKTLFAMLVCAFAVGILPSVGAEQRKGAELLMDKDWPQRSRPECRHSSKVALAAAANQLTAIEIEVKGTFGDVPLIYDALLSDRVEGVVRVEQLSVDLGKQVTRWRVYGWHKDVASLRRAFDQAFQHVAKNGGIKQGARFLVLPDFMLKAPMVAMFGPSQGRLEITLPQTPPTPMPATQPANPAPGTNAAPSQSSHPTSVPIRPPQDGQAQVQPASPFVPPSRPTPANGPAGTSGVALLSGIAALLTAFVRSRS